MPSRICKQPKRLESPQFPIAGSPSLIRGLGRMDNGSPASSLRKAVITCVLPLVLYGTEVWYAGRTKPGHRTCRSDTISTRLCGHVDLVQKTITLAEAKARSAMRLQTISRARHAGTHMAGQNQDTANRRPP